VAPVRQASRARPVQNISVPVPSSTAIEPAVRAALTFWPALNLPTSNEPSRRFRDRSQRRSSRENRLSTPRSAR
jgi:hypothetical protein